MPPDPSRGSLRALRAGVFTSVALLLAAIGHRYAMGVTGSEGPGSFPFPLLLAAPVVLAAAWLFAGRRRQVAWVLAVSVGVQLGLHLLLSRAGASRPVSLAAFWCHTGPVHDLPAGTALAGWHPSSGGSAWPMLAAHLLAAAAAGTWLARGDRALESLLRLLTAASAVALRVILPAVATAATPPARGRTTAGWLPGRSPRRLQLLRISVARRGPPAYAC